MSQQHGRADERARITAYLRRAADKSPGSIVAVSLVRRLAGEIDRGEHLLPPVTNPDLWQECVRGS